MTIDSLSLSLEKISRGDIERKGCLPILVDTLTKSPAR